MTADDYRDKARLVLGRLAIVEERAEVQILHSGAFVQAWVWVGNEANRADNFPVDIEADKP